MSDDPDRLFRIDPDPAIHRRAPSTPRGRGVRALSARQAMSCEQATSKRCRCRCGGAYHGAARVRDEYEALAELPDDDPHLPPLGGSGRQLRLPEAPCAPLSAAEGVAGVVVQVGG
jgi:hypothetical protein